MDAQSISNQINNYWTVYKHLTLVENLHLHTPVATHHVGADYVPNYHVYYYEETIVDSPKVGIID